MKSKPCCYLQNYFRLYFAFGVEAACKTKYYQIFKYDGYSYLELNCSIVIVGEASVRLRFVRLGIAVPEMLLNLKLF